MRFVKSSILAIAAIIALGSSWTMDDEKSGVEKDRQLHSSLESQRAEAQKQLASSIHLLSDPAVELSLWK